MLNLLKDDYLKLCVRYSAMLMYLREKKGLSEKEVAERLGVTRKAVWNWEHFKAIPSAYSAFMLSLLYAVPYELMCCVPPKAHAKRGIQNPSTYAFMTLSDNKLEDYIDEAQSNRMGQLGIWL